MKAGRIARGLGKRDREGRGRVREDRKRKGKDGGKRRKHQGA